MSWPDDLPTTEPPRRIQLPPPPQPKPAPITYPAWVLLACVAVAAVVGVTFGISWKVESQLQQPPTTPSKP